MFDALGYKSTGKTEVANLNVALRVEEEVLGLQVTVNFAAGVDADDA